MLLDVDGAHPVAFVLELLDQMSADKSTGAVYKNFLS